jgi:ATP-dependent Zn protease
MFIKGEIRMKNDFKEISEKMCNMKVALHDGYSPELYHLNYKEVDKILLALKIADKLQSEEVSHSIQWVGSEEILNAENHKKGTLNIAKEAFKAMATQLIQECKEEKE